MEQEHVEPDLVIRMSTTKRKVPPVDLRSSSIADHFKVMRTMDAIKEETSAEIRNNKDQVEVTTPPDNGNDQEGGNQLSQEANP